MGLTRPVPRCRMFRGSFVECARWINKEVLEMNNDETEVVMALQRKLQQYLRNPRTALAAQKICVELKDAASMISDVASQCAAWDLATSILQGIVSSPSQPS